MTETIKTTHSCNEYTLTVDDVDGLVTITIARNGVYAGHGTWDGTMIECPADLDVLVYEALEDALVEAGL